MWPVNWYDIRIKKYIMVCFVLAIVTEKVQNVRNSSEIPSRSELKLHSRNSQSQAELSWLQWWDLSWLQIRIVWPSLPPPLPLNTCIQGTLSMKRPSHSQYISNSSFLFVAFYMYILYSMVGYFIMCLCYFIIVLIQMSIMLFHNMCILFTTCLFLFIIYVWL